MASSRKAAEVEADRARRNGSELIGRLRARLSPHLRPGARLCLGLSGGLDSVVLLHLLAGLREELGFSLSAVHVYHGLSPEADAWAEFCAGLCARLAVPLQERRVRVAGQGHGLEAAARAARYAVYGQQEEDFIVLAHQQDDQAETLLLNVLRGGGVRGAAAMPEMRAMPGAPSLLRPLLDCPRAELVDYAARTGLVWVEDASNQDPGFARNYLRHEVLPILEQRFPACRRTLARAARHFAECEGLLDDLAGLDARLAVDAEGLRIAVLDELSRPRARNLLRWFLAGQGIPPLPAARLEELLDQLTGLGPDNRLVLETDGRRLRVWRGRLRPTDGGTLAPPQTVRWQGEARLDLADGVLEFARAVGRGLSLTRLAAARVEVRRHQTGGRLQPDCRRPRRPLKKLFQERAVPPWERTGLPFLYADDSLVWVAGLGEDCAWQAGAEEAGVLVTWRPGPR